MEVKPKIDEEIIEPIVEEYMKHRGLSDRSEAVLRLGRLISSLIEEDEGMKELEKTIARLSAMPDDPVLKDVKEIMVAKAAQKALTYGADADEKAMKIIEKFTPYILAMQYMDKLIAANRDSNISEEKIREMIRQVIREEIQPLLERSQAEASPSLIEAYERAFNFAKEVINLARSQGQEEKSSLEKIIMESVAKRIGEELATPTHQIIEELKKSIQETREGSNIPPEVWRDIKLKELELQRFREEQRLEMEKLERQEKLEKEKMSRLEKLIGPAIRHFLTKSVPDAKTIRDWLLQRQQGQAREYEFTCPYCGHKRIVKLTNSDLERIASEGYACPACGRTIQSGRQHQASSTPSTAASQPESQKSRESRPSKKRSGPKTTTSSSGQSREAKKPSQESSNSSTSGAGYHTSTTSQSSSGRNTSKTG